MASRSSSWDEAAASNLLGLFFVLALVALVFTVWLTVKIIELLVRTFAAHPTNKALLGTAAASVLLLVVVALTGGRTQPIDVLAGISATALIALAAVLDMADDARLRRPMNRDTAVHAVLHEWWPAA